MPRDEHRPFDEYKQHADRFTERAVAQARRSSALSHARLATFLIALIAGVYAQERNSRAAVVILLAASAAFIMFFILHARVRRLERWNRALALMNRLGLRRLERAWPRLPARTPIRPLTEHPFALDLDLFGAGSLAQMLGPVATAAGTRTLDEWLLEPGSIAELRARQEAVRELAPLHDMRAEIGVLAQATTSMSQSALDSFLVWAEDAPWLSPQPLLVWTSRLLPTATIALMLAQCSGAVTTAYWAIPVALSFALLLRSRVRIQTTFRRAFENERMFDGYPELFARMTQDPLRAPALARDQATLGKRGERADDRIRTLLHLSHLADMRLAMLGVIIDVVLLWDFHVLFALERWQQRAGVRCREWFEAAGRIEATCSLATLAYDHPDWCFAEFSGGGARFDATALGHPLLRDEQRIDNDVTLGPSSTFMLLTGSNMSGKSTLLRAIGVNAVLAQTGAPVCATSLHMTALAPYTAIRKQDSVVEGVSLFMAELRRMKQIVEAARSAPGGRAVLFLLDEMLQGTNTAERRIAARRIIAHLISAHAIGAISTHDLTLLEGSALEQRAVLKHFSEQVSYEDGKPRMTFEYKLRAGLATSTNALVLLRIIGLDDSTTGDDA
jgi:hypothetical protein